MALRGLQIQRSACAAAASSSRCASAQRVVVACSTSARTAAASQQPQQQRQGERQQPPLASQLLAAGLAAGLAFGLPAVPPARAAEQFASLADIVRPSFAFVDANKDGIITKEELQQTSKEVASEIDFMLPGEQQLDFAMRLFDLDQDGRLTAEELLTSVALDGAVSEDALDEAVWKVFDRNADGAIDVSEWRGALPPLGPGGEGIKEYTFGRVDRLVGAGGRLGQQDFANALTLLRISVLGY